MNDTPSASPATRRFAIALALSIALHEIVAGLIPAHAPPSVHPETVENARIVRIARRPLPTPPPPRPTPARTLAPPQPRPIPHTIAGRSAPREIVHRAAAARPRPPVVARTRPVWDVPTGAQGAGAGRNAGAGSLGTGGSGPGAGTSGNGSGAAAANEPCGFVTFSDPHGTRYDPATGTEFVDIEMSVHFADGHSEALELDYPFSYANDAANPWSKQNEGNAAVPTTFQPPPQQLRAGEPPLVQYVMSHTDRRGFTLLKDCPSGPSNR